MKDHLRLTILIVLILTGLAYANRKMVLSWAVRSRFEGCQEAALKVRKMQGEDAGDYMANFCIARDKAVRQWQ